MSLASRVRLIGVGLPVLLAAAATAAVPVEVPYAARTARTPLMNGSFVVVGRPWVRQPALRRCEGSLPATLGPAAACERVAAWVGPLTEFSSPAGDLPAAALARCNQSAGQRHPERGAARASSR